MISQMSVYLEQCYPAPATVLDTVLTTIQEYLVTGKNPIYEMTLLQWLADRHATFSSKHMKAAFGIANTLINAQMSDYLMLLVTLISSSFQTVHAYMMEDVLPVYSL